MEGEHPISLHEKQLKGLEDRMDRAEGNIQALREYREKSIAETTMLMGAIQELKGAIQQLRDLIAPYMQRLTEVANAPVKKDAKKWEAFVGLLWKLGVAAVIGYLISQYQDALKALQNVPHP